jgi:hypothetical protein
MRLELAIILMFMVFQPSRLDAQPLSRRILSGDFQRFDVDNLGNLYVLTSGNQLRKYSSAGDSIGVFNDVVKYGRLRSLDVSNPLRILLFYRDFGTILLLDRMLKPLDAIDLRRSSMMQVSAVATSYDNQCWVYDEQEARLRKIDAQGRLVLESPDLRMIMDEVPAPALLSDQQGNVTLYDSERGFYRFDLYGAFQQRIPLVGWLNVKASGESLTGISQGRIIRYELKTGRLFSTSLPVNEADIRQCIIRPGWLYVLDEAGLLIVTLTEDTTR